MDDELADELFHDYLSGVPRLYFAIHVYGAGPPSSKAESAKRTAKIAKMICKVRGSAPPCLKYMVLPRFGFFFFFMGLPLQNFWS